MTWIKDSLLPVYFPTSSYSGGSISIRDKFFIADMANVRLGLIRMRQLRVQKGNVLYMFVLFQLDNIFNLMFSDSRYWLINQILRIDKYQFSILWLFPVFVMLNATFNNISAISWRSVLLVEETGVPGKKHLPVASHITFLWLTPYLISM